MVTKTRCIWLRHSCSKYYVLGVKATCRAVDITSVFLFGSGEVAFAFLFSLVALKRNSARATRCPWRNRHQGPARTQLLRRQLSVPGRGLGQLFQKSDSGGTLRIRGTTRVLLVSVTRAEWQLFHVTAVWFPAWQPGG